MAENKKELVVSLKAKIGGFVGSFAKAAKALKDFARVNKEMNKRMGETENRSKRLVRRHDEYIQALNRSQEVISKRGLYRYRVMESIAVAGLLAGPIRKTIQDQTERAKLGTALKLSDNENLKEATKPIHDLSKSIPLTAEGLMKIGQAGAKIGISRKNLVEFTKEVGKSLVSWRDTVDSGTVEKIARLVKLQKVSVSKLPRIFDMFTYLGGKAGTTPGEILEVIDGVSEKLSGFKLSIPQISALSGTLLSLGVDSGKASTAINGLFQTLSKGDQIGSRAENALHRIGLMATPLQRMIAENPQNLLDRLFGGLKKLGTADRNQVLNDLFGKGATASHVGLLVENLDDYKNLRKVLETDDYKGKREKEYNKVVEELGSKFQLLGNSLKDLMQTVTITVFPILTPIIEKFKKWTDAITDFAEKQPKLVGAITSIIGAILGLRVIRFAGSYLFHLLTGWIPATIARWTKLKLWWEGFSFISGISSLLSWVTLFAVAALLIWKYWEPIKKFFLSIWEDVEPYWTKFCEKITGWADNIIDAWKGVKNFFAELWNELSLNIKKFASPLTSIWDEAKSTGRKIGNFFGWSESANSKLEIASKIKPNSSSNTRNLNITSPITVNVNGANNPTLVANEVTDRIKGYYETLLFDEAARAI